MANDNLVVLQSRLTFWLSWAIMIVLLDQVTKVLIYRTFFYGELYFINSFFNLTLLYNKGAAFSFLANAGGWQRWVFTGLGILAALIIIWLLDRHGRQKIFCTALTMILGGALGNVVDRLIHGHVIDFLDFHWRGYHWPAFNFADAAITCGAILLILDEILRVRRT